MWFFRRKGPSGFSSSSTAEEVTQGIDASGLTAIVTGKVHLLFLSSKLISIYLFSSTLIMLFCAVYFHLFIRFYSWKIIWITHFLVIWMTG